MDTKKGAVILCSVLLVFLAVGLSGCLSQSAKDYFPVKEGTEWSYEIKLERTLPLTYEVTSWPSGKVYHRIPVIPEYYPWQSDRYHLKIAVRDYDETDGVVSLNIIEDDLGFFNNADFVWWELSDVKDGLVVDQKLEYIKSTSQPREFLVGISTRAIFFNGDAGKSKSYVTGEEDSLKFVGIDDKVPGYKAPCLHFVREVKKGNGRYPYADKGFTEDVWYAPDIGLVRLEQKVEGQNSMIWTLEKFVPGGQ